jgi:hypothetical protein
MVRVRRDRPVGTTHALAESGGEPLHRRDLRRRRRHHPEKPDPSEASRTVAACSFAKVRAFSFVINWRMSFKRVEEHEGPRSSRARALGLSHAGFASASRRLGAIPARPPLLVRARS